MSDRLLTWSLRLSWALVPFIVWPVVAGALRHHSGSVRLTAAVGSWVVWAAILLATLVPHPIGLTALRCVTPAMAVAALSAAGLSDARAWTSAAGAGIWATAILTMSFLPRTGIVFVNGPAYPNERRFPLAVPGALLLGPIELAWLTATGLPVAAAFLLAARNWVAGGAAAAGAVAAGWLLGRALHGLSRRWAVFVPAGLVLHDALSLADPVLLRRQVIEALRPARTGSDSLDLTQAAPGLALEVVLTEKVAMTRVTARNRRGEPGSSARLRFSPTRPGLVLAEAITRRIAVSAAPPVESSGPEAALYGAPLGPAPATPPPSTSSPS